MIESSQQFSTHAYNLQHILTPLVPVLVPAEDREICDSRRLSCHGGDNTRRHEIGRQVHAIELPLIT